MKAEDTVITNLAEAILKHTDLPMGQAIAKKQAEISFRAGIQEVVGWMFESCPHAPRHFPSDKRMCVQCCEAKLKEWGIESKKEE